MSRVIYFYFYYMHYDYDYSRGKIIMIMIILEVNKKINKIVIVFYLFNK